MAVADTLNAMLAAAPELSKTPSLTLSVAQGAAQQLTSAPDPKGHVQATAQTTALALILKGMQLAAQNVTENAYQPEEPEPTL